MLVDDVLHHVPDCSLHVFQGLAQVGDGMTKPRKDYENPDEAALVDESVDAFVDAVHDRVVQFELAASDDLPDGVDEGDAELLTEADRSLPCLLPQQVDQLVHLLGHGLLELGLAHPELTEFFEQELPLLVPDGA